MTDRWYTAVHILVSGPPAGWCQMVRADSLNLRYIAPAAQALACSALAYVFGSIRPRFLRPLHQQQQRQQPRLAAPLKRSWAVFNKWFRFFSRILPELDLRVLISTYKYNDTRIFSCFRSVLLILGVVCRWRHQISLALSALSCSVLGSWKPGNGSGPNNNNNNNNIV